MGKLKTLVELPELILALIEERNCVLFGSGAKYHLGLRLALPNDYDIIVPKSDWYIVVSIVQDAGYQFIGNTSSGNGYRFRNYTEGVSIRQIDLVAMEDDSVDSFVNILKRAQCHAQDNSIFCIYSSSGLKRKLT